MIREAIKTELKKRNWSVSRLAEESGIRYPSLTKFLNQNGSLSVDNLDIVFETLNLSILYLSDKDLIAFAVHLTGHDEDTILQMYEDWKNSPSV